MFRRFLHTRHFANHCALRHRDGYGWANRIATHGGCHRRDDRHPEDRSVRDQRALGRPRSPSTLFADVFLLFFVVVLGDWVAHVPTGALVAVMITVSVGTFDWNEVDLTHAHVWDASAVAAVDRVILRLRSRGTRVQLSGVNAASTALLGRLAIHDRPGAVLANAH
jgi:MFS superfamily sulfate permease-like transporter